MKCDKIEAIMTQLRELHSIMVKLMPKDHINQHPFDFFKEDLNLVTENIKKCTQKFNDRLNKTKECSKLLIDEYKKIVSELNSEETAIPKFKNAYLEIEFVINELERVISRRKQLERKLTKKSMDIYEILEELGLLAKDYDEGMFRPILQDNLNIDSLKISENMVVVVERFTEHEEAFVQAGLYDQFIKVKELLREKHFTPEREIQCFTNHSSTRSNANYMNEDILQLYNALKIDGDTNIYFFVFSLLEKNEISYEKLSQLEISFKILQFEKMEKEKQRRTIFRNTSLLLKRLGIVDRELTMDQKLFRLEELENKYSEMVEKREKEVVDLLNSIRDKEEILNLNIRDFKEGYKKPSNIKDVNASTISVSPLNDSFLTMENDSTLNRIEDCSQDISTVINATNCNKEINGSITTSNIEYLRGYLQQLTEEYNNRINEIFMNTKEYLEELCKLFTLQIEEFEVSTEGISAMRAKIEELEPKKDLYLEILSMISKREDLLESMNEFEKIASDPRRLFKSSFQLLREEKFRKSAFPSLLKIEEQLLKLLETYKEKFGEFKRNDKPFALTLKEEIEGRIINKTVFINKFDSPIRRKKN